MVSYLNVIQNQNVFIEGKNIICFHILTYT